MKATIRVDIKGDGTSVAFDFDLADPADRSRFKATCGLLSRPEVTGESRERFLRQVVAVVDDVVAGKVPGQPPSRTAAPSPFTKTALDVAADRAGGMGIDRGTRPALDLSEILGKPVGNKGGTGEKKQ